MKKAGFQGYIRAMKRFFLSMFLLVFIIPLLEAQVITSERAWIHLNPAKKPEPVAAPDTKPPVIKLITPEMQQGEKIKSDKPEINILARITDDASGVNRILVNAVKFDPSPDGLFIQKFPLVKGENILKMQVVDNRDNYAEMNLVVEYIPESSVSAYRLTVSGKYYALLIGINEYRDPELPNLDHPISDATNLHNVLVSDYVFDKENVILLKNAKRADINMALDDLAKKITVNDNLLIFYAGHGWWDQKADIGYWLPADASRSYKTEWFRNSTLCDYIREINSKHTLLITDACFGGSIFKTRGVSMDAPKAIQMLYDLPSRKAMTSGTLTEVPDRSSFVKYLIERLDENGESCLSSEQLFSSFRIAVINNSDVIPQYGEIKSVGDEGGDFIFIRREQ